MIGSAIVSFLIAGVCLFFLILLKNKDYREVMHILSTYPEDCQYEGYKRGDVVCGFKKSIQTDMHRSFDWSYNSMKNKRFEELQQLLAYMKYYNYESAEKAAKIANDQKEQWKLMAKYWDSHSKVVRYNMTEKETNPYGLAGMASGIGGPIAGAATLVEIETENARIRQRNAEKEGMIRQAELDSIGNAITAEKYAEYYSNSATTYTNITKQNGELHELFSKLKGKIQGYQITDSGAVKVTVTFAPVIDGIDGNVAAKIIQNGNCVGRAYFVLPAGGLISKEKYQMEGICTKTQDCNAKYTIELEPINLYIDSK